MVSLIFKENYDLAQKLVLKGACPFIAEKIFERYPNKGENQLKMLETYKSNKYSHFIYKFFFLRVEIRKASFIDGEAYFTENKKRNIE